MSRTRRILIVDDESAIREMIVMALELAGYETLEACDAKTAHAMVIDEKPDMMLLDWMMPGTSGIELAKRLRSDPTTKDLPIIMLTAKADEDNKVQGLEAGIDDYITKPFSPKELIARLKAVLRRSLPESDEGAISIGGIILDPVSHRVSNAAGQSLNLGPTEFKLLHLFMTHQDRAYSRGQLLDMVWGGNVYVEERTVDVHIRRLRKALGPELGHLIQTVRGTGYRFSTKL